MKPRLLESATALSLIALLAITGCKTTSGTPANPQLNGFTGIQGEMEERLATPANNAIAQGKTAEALDFYAKLYKTDKSADVALNYAQLLRKTGKVKQSLDILSPFVANPDNAIKGNAAPIMSDEYAAANIEAGDYKTAENALDHVLKDKTAKSFYPDAHDLLGIALDAEGKHRNAEKDYRLALDSWKGDPTAVMNNLGLCLASQRRFDESLTTLRQALIKAPHNEEIARNIDMVTNLEKTSVSKAPIRIRPHGKKKHAHKKMNAPAAPASAPAGSGTPAPK